MRKELYFLLIASRKSLTNIMEGEKAISFYINIKKITKKQLEVFGGEAISRIIKSFYGKHSSSTSG